MVKLSETNSKWKIPNRLTFLKLKEVVLNENIIRVVRDGKEVKRFVFAITT